MNETKNTPIEKTQMNPTQLLHAQYSVLSKMHHEQSIQMEGIKHELEQINLSFEKLKLGERNSTVKVEDFDMPFTAMIKLMVKIGLASIPAFIILGIIFGCFWINLMSTLGQ